MICDRKLVIVIEHRSVVNIGTCELSALLAIAHILISRYAFDAYFACKSLSSSGMARFRIFWRNPEIDIHLENEINELREVHANYRGRVQCLSCNTSFVLDCVRFLSLQVEIDIKEFQTRERERLGRTIESFLSIFMLDKHEIHIKDIKYRGCQLDSHIAYSFVSSSV